MKAWRVWIKNQGGDTWSSCVFADTRNKAKKIWFDEWAHECNAEWIDIIVRREPKFDGCYDKPHIFDGSHELKSIREFWNVYL